MSGAHVFIDRSQFPERVQGDLIDSLRARALNHKFHYESYKQAAKWLALHEVFSPARHDESCRRIYDDAFAAAAGACAAGEIHLLGLGCGGGQKEARLAELLNQRRLEIAATVSDVSVPLVLTARQTVSSFVRDCCAAVCDLATAGNLRELITPEFAARPRLVTLFGLIPNFEPCALLPRISALLRAEDVLLLSANLAPGPDYAAGVEKVLPQYDNALTRDWLMTLLLDLGFELDDGSLRFSMETDADGMKRIAAHFELQRARDIRVFGERVSFEPGERIRVFFSYRHTPQTLDCCLQAYGIRLRAHWVNDSGEEGVFLCARA